MGWDLYIFVVFFFLYRFHSFLTHYNRAGFQGYGDFHFCFFHVARLFDGWIPTDPHGEGWGAL